MNTFKPTFLYIKQHSITGMLYFGKTYKNPTKYIGSGLYWRRHLSTHGVQHVNTIWYCLYTDQDECTKFAQQFSIQEDIVNSNLWANLTIENGLDGAPVGHPSFVTNPGEVSRKISESSRKNWSDPVWREKVIQSQKDAWTIERREAQSKLSKQLWTSERKQNHSEKLSGRKGSKLLRGVPKSEEHNRKNSEAHKGKIFTEEHRKRISEARKLQRVCRLFDKREMSMCHFTRWINSLSNTTTD